MFTDENTKTEIMQALDTLEIKYNSKDSKQDLLDLLNSLSKLPEAVEDISVHEPIIEEPTELPKEEIIGLPAEVDVWGVKVVDPETLEEVIEEVAADVELDSLPSVTEVTPNTETIEDVIAEVIAEAIDMPPVTTELAVNGIVTEDLYQNISGEVYTTTNEFGGVLLVGAGEYILSKLNPDLSVFKPVVI